MTVSHDNLACRVMCGRRTLQELMMTIPGQSPATAQSYHKDIVTIDLGTKSMSTCHEKFTPAHPTWNRNFNRIELSTKSNEQYVAPSIAVWHKVNKEWIIGHDFELRQDMLQQEDIIIITNFKILLYDSYRRTEHARQVHKHLKGAGQTLEDVYTEVLKYVWRHVCQYFQNHPFDRRSNGPSRDTLVYVTVPKLVTFEARELLGRAARRALLPRMRMIFEPLAAAACILEGWNRDPQASVKLPMIVSHPALTLLPHS